MSCFVCNASTTLDFELCLFNLVIWNFLPPTLFLQLKHWLMNCLFHNLADQCIYNVGQKRVERANVQLLCTVIDIWYCCLCIVLSESQSYDVIKLVKRKLLIYSWIVWPSAFCATVINVGKSIKPFWVAGALRKFI